MVINSVWRKYQYEEVNSLWFGYKCQKVHIPLFCHYALILRCLLHGRVTFGWWFVCISYLKKPSFVIYSFVLLISLFQVFSIRLKGKRDNPKRRTLKWKGRCQKQQHLDIKIIKLINGVVVSILNLFHFENSRHKLIIANFICLNQDVQCIPLFFFKGECILPSHSNTWCISLGGAHFYFLIMLKLTLKFVHMFCAIFIIILVIYLICDLFKEKDH
jgi:hypothetical protein